jgi:hypothetical protein
MAGENQNTGPNQQSNLDPSKIRNYLKGIIEDQEDLSGVLRDTLKELKKTETAYEKIQARLERVSSGAVDVKAIQTDLNRLVDKEFIKKLQLQEIEKEAGENGKERLNQIKLEAQAYIERVKNTSLAATYEETMMDFLATEENHMLTQLFLSEQSLELAKKRVSEGENLLSIEKKLSASLGIEGKLLKNFADKLGVGAEYYEEMSRQARKLNEEGKKFGFIDKVVLLGKLAKDAFIEAVKSPLTYIAAIHNGIKNGINLAKDGLTSLTGSGGPFANFVSPFTNLIKQIPLVGGLIGGIVDAFANLADYATEAGSQVQLFARNLGLSVQEATQLNTQYSNLAHTSGDLLYNSRKFREAQMEIAEATGRNNLLSKEALQTQIQLKEIAGIDLETRKELVDVETVSGVRQDKIVKAAMGTSNFISKTLGVSIKWQNILKEASSLSGVLGLSFAKYPEKLTRSLATVKSMGLELKQLDSLADSFLDFESSISKEFEAQLLTGKNINLTKAREAFLNNDLVAAGKELVTQLGTSGEFLRYNRIQQEALAASAGMTKDQVADMLKQQELFSKFQVNDVKEYQKKVALMTQTIEGQKELVGLLGEEEYSKVMSQTATEKIANFIEKIKQSFADLLSSSSFKGFLDKVINFISDPKNIENLLSKITGFISVMIRAVASVLSGLDQLPFVEIDKGIINSIKGYADELSSTKLGSLSSNIGGVSVGENVASSQVKNSQGAAESLQNNMSMVKPTVNVINNTKVEAIKGQALTDVAVQWSYGDITSGPQRFQS